MASSKGLRVTSLSKGFGPRRIITDASFDVAPGEIACLTGDNGAGKTTLLRCLVGLSRYLGDATLDGHRLDGSARSLANVGYVPQAPALLESASVGETLDFYARLRGVRAFDGDFPEEALPALDERIVHLSGGQRQRVALAIGSLGTPRLLLLDEPTANLDDQGRETAASMMRRAAQRGCAVVIVSPAAIDLVDLVDRFLVLAGGRVAEADETYAPIRARLDRGRWAGGRLRAVEAVS